MSIQDSPKRRSKPRNWAAALLLANAALIGASFAPGLEAVSGYLRAATIFTTLGAIGVVIATWTSNKPSMRREKFGKGAALVGTFVAAAIITNGAAVATSDNSIPEAFTLNTAPMTTTALPVSQVTFDPTEEELEATLESAADKAALYSTIEGEESEQLIAAAQATDYELRSGLGLDWANAMTQSNGEMRIVTIPIVGGDALADVSKLVYIRSGNETAVVESVAHMIDESKVNLLLWQDGSMIKNADLINPNVVENETGIAQAFSWKVLNKCLSNAGISWFIISAISVTCAAVCVGTAGFGCVACIAGLAGANGGLITACVQSAAKA